MRAVIVRRYGPPEMLEYREWPDPVPGPNQVLVRVAAVGINFADLWSRMGIYTGVPKAPFVPGLELAGVVVAAPAGAHVKAGDPVAATPHMGAYAELAAVPAERVFRVPDGMAPEIAAAIPVTYLTAYHSMFYMGNLQAGDRILVHGAAGGVGIACVQLAKARGLVVFGSAGPGKQELLRQMGVDHPMDYTRQNFVEVVRRAAPEGIEMVMDAIGGKSFRQSYRCLGPTGRLVVYGLSAAAGPSGRRNPWRMVKAYLQTPRFAPLDLIDRNITVIGVHLGRLGARGAVLKPQIEEIFRLYAAGKVKPVIGKTFPLAEAAEAHRYIHRRQNIGKVILKV